MQWPVSGRKWHVFSVRRQPDPCVRALNVNLLLVGRKLHQVQTACQPRGEDPSSNHSALPRRGVLRLGT